MKIIINTNGGGKVRGEKRRKERGMNRKTIKRKKENKHWPLI